MKINNIKEESQSSLFLATIGPSTYKTLKNLFSPSLPGDKSYEELKNMLKEHFDPKPIIIAERYRFWNANSFFHSSLFIYFLTPFLPGHWVDMVALIFDLTSYFYSGRRNCADPGIIDNGNKIGDHLWEGESLTFFCNDGGKPRGNKTLTCLSNGTWSSELPSCVYLKGTLQSF